MSISMTNNKNNTISISNTICGLGFFGEFSGKKNSKTLAQNGYNSIEYEYRV